MNALTKIADAPAQDATDIALIELTNPVAILTNPQAFDAFYEQVKAKTDELEPDVSTAKGRDEIRAMAMKVVRTKTALDAAGLAQTEEWRASTAKVNAARNLIKEKLDALRDQVRKPLSDWEEADKARIAECERILTLLRDGSVVTLDDTSQTVSARIAEVEALIIADDLFQDLADNARANRQVTLDALGSALDRLVRDEAQRAELERLRAAEVERLRLEQERLDREAEERLAEEQRVEQERQDRERAEQAERDRLAAEAQAAEQTRQAAAAAARQAQEQAEAAQRARDDQHRQELAAAQQKAAEAEAESRRVAAAAAEAERLRLQQEQQAQAAAEARARDQEHRAEVLAEAVGDLVTHARLTKAQAQIVALAITGGNVRHTSIEF